MGNFAYLPAFLAADAAKILAAKSDLVEADSIHQFGIRDSGDAIILDRLRDHLSYRWRYL